MEVGLHGLQHGRVGWCILIARALLHRELADTAWHAADVVEDLRVLIHPMSLLAVVTAVHQVVVGIDGLPGQRQRQEHEDKAQQRDKDVGNHHDRLLGLNLRTRRAEEDEDRRDVEADDPRAQADHPGGHGGAHPEDVVHVLHEGHGVPDGHHAKHCEEEDARGDEYVLGAHEALHVASTLGLTLLRSLHAVGHRRRRGAAVAAHGLHGRRPPLLHGVRQRLRRCRGGVRHCGSGLRCANGVLAHLPSRIGVNA
mmetsp:Transcript_26382/g.61974  ORF Transcript_26382/g.61974 Transcript_26382/m.61974 type:complete len:254 (-) Transcript_26382:7-768(-)